MVTQFNRKDLGAFAKYFSEIDSQRNENDPMKGQVTHANVENWLELIKNKGKNPVLAKFRCNGSDDNEDTSQFNFEVVMDGSEENKSFSKYTPFGAINIGIDKGADAHDYFEENKEYFVKFTKV